jgi:hypothetical protein
LDVGLEVFCALRRRPHASLNVPAALQKKIKCLVVIGVEAAKFPPEGSKRRIFGSFGEELPPQEAGGHPVMPITSNAKLCYEFAHLPFVMLDAQSQPRLSENTLKSYLINKLNFAFKKVAVSLQKSL